MSARAVMRGMLHWLRRGLLSIAIGVAAVSGTSGGAGAQTLHNPAFAIVLAPIVFVEAGTSAKFPIRIRPADTVEAGSFVRVRGVPQTAALSDGYLIAAGIWAVPLVSLQELSLTVPGGSQGRSDLTVSLVNVEGAILAETRTVLVVVPPGAVQKSEPPQAAPPPAVAAPPVVAAPMVTAPPSQSQRPPAPVLSVEDRARALELLVNGDDQLKVGNIAGARRFFARAADIGLPDAAIALGDTYEAGGLARLGVLGIAPDNEQARRWYQRAMELGAPEASERLRRLPQ